MTMFHQNKFLS